MKKKTWKPNWCKNLWLHFSSASIKRGWSKRVNPRTHDNYLKIIISSHPCCEGYFYLSFPCQQSEITWQHSNWPMRCRLQNNHALWHRTCNRFQIIFIGRGPCRGDLLSPFILSCERILRYMFISPRAPMLVASFFPFKHGFFLWWWLSFIIASEIFWLACHWENKSRDLTLSMVSN